MAELLKMLNQKLSESRKAMRRRSCTVKIKKEEVTKELEESVEILQSNELPARCIQRSDTTMYFIQASGAEKANIHGESPRSRTSEPVKSVRDWQIAEDFGRGT